MGVGTFQVLIGIGAVAGGYGLIADPSGAALGLPLDLLDGSPFSDYLIPGVVLFTVNGLGTLLASATTFRRSRRAAPLAIALGLVMIAWIVVQVAIIGYTSWLQPTYVVVGLVETACGFMLNRAGFSRG